MVVMEKKIGNSTLRIHDDYLVSEPEKKRILENIGRIVSQIPDPENKDAEKVG